MSESTRPTSFTDRPGMSGPGRQPLFLGVDGGGTGTEACVMDAHGTPIAKGRGGPSNINYISESAFVDSLRAAILEALSRAGISARDLAGACLALAGAGDDNPLRIRRLISPVLGSCPFIIVEDTYSALSAAHEGKNGIVVIAGTGSNCLGMKDGRYASAGGYGALLGDEGGAYSIAVKGLRAALRSRDGRDGPTLLTSLLLRGTGMKEPRDFIPLTFNLDRPGIAALSKHIFEAADESDKASLKILEDEASHLADMVKAVAASLGLTAPRVAAKGGCFNNKAYLSELERQLRRALPRARLIDAPRPASEGAAILAKDHFSKGMGLR